IYLERLVYRTIAERSPDCRELFEFLKSDPETCADTKQTFARLYARAVQGEDLAEVLRGLPTSGKPN
ncbi:MAG: hypothetical protein WCC59_17970, partial [Terriglobales bacterium]